MIKAYRQYFIFLLFIRFPVFILASKVTELPFDFSLQIIYLLEYQNFVCLTLFNSFNIFVIYSNTFNIYFAPFSCSANIGKIRVKIGRKTN